MKIDRQITRLIYAVFFLNILVFTSCSENEMMDYALPAKVYIHEVRTVNMVEEKLTEKNYSFALRTSGPVIDEDTVKVNVRLMGNLENRDRVLRAVVDAENSTAIAGTHYKLLDGVIKANEYDGYFPVVIYRTPDTQEEAVYITLNLIETEDFGLGHPDDLSFKITWGDVLLRPTNWPYYFGAYSANKYRFVIDQLGLTDWPQATRYATGPEDGVYTGSQLQAFAAQLTRAYAIYKATYGPIYMDDNAENKREIDFVAGY